MGVFNKQPGTPCTAGLGRQSEDVLHQLQFIWLTVRLISVFQVSLTSIAIHTALLLTILGILKVRNITLSSIKSSIGKYILNIPASEDGGVMRINEMHAWRGVCSINIVFGDQSWVELKRQISCKPMVFYEVQTIFKRLQIIQNVLLRALRFYFI